MENKNVGMDPYIWAERIVLDELPEVLNSINSLQMQRFVKELVATKENGGKILGYAAGRMGLALKAFIMRLNHLGFNAYWFGDTYVPPMNENDMFVCCSNSGTTKSVANILDIFKKKSNGKVVAFVGNKESYMAQEANMIVEFKTCNGGLNSADDPTKINSKQPMTTLTEQAMFILFDIVAMMLIRICGIDIKETKQFHSNIE